MRLILIDNNSGYINGDTADLPQYTLAGAEFPMTQSDLQLPADAILAARWMDEGMWLEFGRSYEFLSRAPHDTSTGYLVYRADVGGSDAIPVVQDGTNQETINAVERDCEFLGYVAVVPCDDEWLAADEYRAIV